MPINIDKLQKQLMIINTQFYPPCYNRAKTEILIFSDMYLIEIDKNCSKPITIDRYALIFRIISNCQYYAIDYCSTLFSIV